MATNLAEPQSLTVAPSPRWDAPTVYDRSSLPGDCLVMIAGQSEADYLRLAPENQFCEFLDGIVYMPPNVSAQHQEDVGALQFLLRTYILHRRVGYISAGPAVFKLRAGRRLEPDLFVLPEASRAETLSNGYGVPPALLIVEVLSPSNREYDLDIKADAYRGAQVDEIWYVDRPNRVVIVERPEGKGPGYTRHEVHEGPIVARSLPGFWFDAGWLWQEPQPDWLRCIELILAGPPGAA